MPSSTIPRTPTPESSQIDSYGYDAATKRLAVKFKSTQDKVYEYTDVAPEVFAAMQAAESKGSFVYKAIKPKYQFERMVEPEPETAGTDSEGGETA